MKQIKLLDPIFVVLFLLVGFIPYFDSIDKIAPQYVYLSFLTPITSVYVLFTSEKAVINKATVVFISFFLFILWSFLSFFYAINKAEVLIESSRTVIFFITFVNFFFLLNRNRELLKYIPFLISFILLVEVFLVYERFFERYSGVNYSRDMGLRAFSGNINITAFSFLLKLPFLLYTISRIRLNFFLKIFVFSSFTFCLFLLGSRGANLVLIIVFTLIVLIHLLFKSKSFVTNKTIAIALMGILVGGISNYLIFRNNKSLNIIERSSNLDTDSTQQRIRFYSAAIRSINENPVFGVGMGNWKIHATDYDKPFMIDYTVPYHVHNDFLELTAELGVIGFILYFGIFLWIFFLIFQSIKSGDYKEQELFFLVFIGLISILVYLADSFLNFPFTRPLMQIQNLFFWAIILVILNINFQPNVEINFSRKPVKLIALIFILSGSIFTFYISNRVYNSFVDQQFLIAAGNGSYTNYSREEVFSIQSDLPSITASTVPIETAKANLIYNIGFEDDTLHYMINQGEKKNPFLPYNDLTRSVLYIKQRKPDSAYVYAKKAYYDITNNYVHFNLMMDIIEAYKDSLELEKAIKNFRGEMRNQFYEKYLTVSYNIKNKVGLTESNFIEKYNSKNPDSDVIKTFRAIAGVGKKDVEKGYLESINAKKLFEEGKFKESALSFLKASKLNPLEVSYIENAANAYMQFGNEKKAISILEEMIENLNPNTGKAEYLLGILFIGEKKNTEGCEYLEKSFKKGFNVPEIIFQRFCDLSED